MNKRFSTLLAAALVAGSFSSVSHSWRGVMLNGRMHKQAALIIWQGCIL